MSEEGKIGMNGLDTGGSGRPVGMRESRVNGRNVMARSTDIGRAKPVRRRARTIGLLLVFGVAIFVVSAMSLVTLGNDKAVKPEPAQTSQEPPPYTIAGRTYDAGGARLAGCSVVVTDVTKGKSSPTLTSSSTGFYTTQLQTWCPEYAIGDELYVYASKDIMYGENTTVVASGAGTAIDVTLNLEIPEFPAVVVPIVGMMGLFVAVAMIRRRD